MNNALCEQSESIAYYEAGKSVVEAFCDGAAAGINSPSEYWLEISEKSAEIAIASMEAFSKDPRCLEVQRIIAANLSGEDG